MCKIGGQGENILMELDHEILLLSNPKENVSRVTFGIKDPGLNIL